MEKEDVIYAVNVIDVMELLNEDDRSYYEEKVAYYKKALDYTKKTTKRKALLKKLDFWTLWANGNPGEAWERYPRMFLS